MTSAVVAGAVYFAGVFAAGFGLGVLRTLLWAPALGPTLAVAVELPIILTIAWLACRRILRRWPLRRGEAVAMGAGAFVWLMAAEAGVSMGLAGRSLGEHLSLYAQGPHLLGLGGQLAFACFPLIQTWRGRRTAST
jgi:hypothetical protein